MTGYLDTDNMDSAKCIILHKRIIQDVPSHLVNPHTRLVTHDFSLVYFFFSVNIILVVQKLYNFALGS